MCTGRLLKGDTGTVIFTQGHNLTQAIEGWTEN